MKVEMIEKYIKNYAIRPFRSLVTRSLEEIGIVVVIPVLAEKSSLFTTLASISANDPAELRHTLVICVVNNHTYPLTSSEEFDNNQGTLKILHALILGHPSSPLLPQQIQSDYKKIAESRLRVALIDASSHGYEIPAFEGGVGTARKIGMDAAVAAIDRKRGRGVICCLDADTLVQENYVSAVSSHFSRTDHPGAVLDYSHQASENKQISAAIACYELFLSYYVLALSYAKSPYAFHTIGSAMACSIEGYCAVRGMNRRAAAEDFHFLNKLAKIGKIGMIAETTVFPSARPSTRVPFGTGRWIINHLSGQTDGTLFYDFRIFSILKKWLTFLEGDPRCKPACLLAEAHHIHPSLEEYLLSARFDVVWRTIQRNASDPNQLRMQFHIWFDGLKTLKLVHHLSRCAFPMVPMLQALQELLVQTGRKYFFEHYFEQFSSREIQQQILKDLRIHLLKT